MEVIVKPTLACNGTCVYCSAQSPNQPSTSWPASRLGEFFAPFVPWMERKPNERLHFIWHGGEPMLRGIDFYREALRQEKQIFGANIGRVTNAIQTNLSLMNEEWAAFFPEFLAGERVGTSIDLVPGVRGLKSREPLVGIWLNAVRMLRSAGVSVGVVYVVHKKSLGTARNLYYFFRNLDPAVSLRFNPLYAQGSGADDSIRELWITPEEYGAFLVELCDAWLEDGMRTSVRPVDEWYQAWKGDAGKLCCDSKGVCHGSHLGIESDGAVFGCGRSADSRLGELGNIFEVGDVGQLLEHPFRKEMTARARTLREGDCNGCRFWPMCRGGCPVMGWAYTGDMFKKDHFCGARVTLFGHFERLFGPSALAPEHAVST